MPHNYIICHYGEIGLKGKNRKYFEGKLISNIEKALKQGSFYQYIKKVSRISGRILVELAAGRNSAPNVEVCSAVCPPAAGIKQALANVFGIANFSFAHSSGQGIQELKQKAVEVMRQIDATAGSFRVSAKRAQKDYPLTSQEINEQVGAIVAEKLNFKVQLEKPDTTLFIEIVDNRAFLFTEKITGPGGLPVGVSGQAVCLLSGGIDSPVAAYYAMKRGLEVVFVHFHTAPYTDKASVDKARELVKVLAKYQNQSKLYLVGFADIQKEILLKTEANLRVVLYRRFMFRIAEQIAKKERAKALVTGENLAQVASQTLENMSVIAQAVALLVIKPLVCDDKIDIIAKAKNIGVYDISILPHQDCCSRFLPERPETKARLKDVIAQEKKLKVDELISKALKQTNVEKI